MDCLLLSLVRGRPFLARVTILIVVLQDSSIRAYRLQGATAHERRGIYQRWRIQTLLPVTEDLPHARLYARILQNSALTFPVIRHGKYYHPHFTNKIIYPSGGAVILTKLLPAWKSLLFLWHSIEEFIDSLGLLILEFSFLTNSFPITTWISPTLRPA